MIPYDNRFHRRNAIRYLYLKGEAYRSRYITLKKIPRKAGDSNANPTRAVVVISKKTLKSAVRRNLVRRRIYAIIRDEIKKFDKSYDLALIVSSAEVLSLSHRDLKDLVCGLFQEANMYK